MRLTLSPTPEIVELNGTACRQWTGTTDTGVAVVAFIAAVGIRGDSPAAEQARFERELVELVGSNLGIRAVLVFP